MIKFCFFLACFSFLLCSLSAQGAPLLDEWAQARSFKCGEGKLLIPNAYGSGLTPGGYRDEPLQALAWSVKNLRLTFFDQKGREIYQLQLDPTYLPQEVDIDSRPHKQLNLDWTGNSLGKPLPEGSYFYMLEWSDLTGKRCRESGNLLLQKKD